MKAYPEKICVYDDDVTADLFTVEGVDESAIELKTTGLWLACDEEIDELCDTLKKCLKAYQEGL